MENALIGKTIGDHVKIEIPANEAFGNVQEFEPLKFHRRDFGVSFDKLYVGAAIPFKDDQENDIVLYVTNILGSYVTLNINHPLAGKILKFDAKVLGIRNASTDELNSGFPFGVDGTDKPSSCACC